MKITVNFDRCQSNALYMTAAPDIFDCVCLPLRSYAADRSDGDASSEWVSAITLRVVPGRPLCGVSRAAKRLLTRPSELCS